MKKQIPLEVRNILQEVQAMLEKIYANRFKTVILFANSKYYAIFIAANSAYFLTIIF